jgi:hypothetical protein
MKFHMFKRRLLLLYISFHVWFAVDTIELMKMQLYNILFVERDSKIKDCVETVCSL